MLIRSISTKVLTFTRFNSSHKASEILLYDNPSRPKFVLLISMAAGIQFVFWGYLSYSALSDYYSATVKGKENLHDPQSLAEKDKVMMEHLETLQSKSSLKWRVTFSLLALSMGAFFGLTALMYPRRMVNRLTFNSKNNMLTISTSTPTGGLRHSEVPILDVQSMSASNKSTHQALKVKGHRLFYLLDKQGSFPNLSLYDNLIGIRKF